MKQIKQNLIGPLSLKQLKNMNGKPAYCLDDNTWGVIAVDELGRWAEKPFFRGRWEQVNFEYDIEARNLKIFTLPIETEQIYSSWLWYEDWSPATIDGPAECLEAGWYCGHCGWNPGIELGLYFDDPENSPKFNFCPNCGLPIKNEIKVSSQNQKESFLYLDVK